MINPSEGGSYLRLPDGSLQRRDSTAPGNTPSPAPPKPPAAPVTPAERAKGSKPND